MGTPTVDSWHAGAGKRRVVLVDLNNHARYPTLPVGLMTAILRRAGHEVTLLSPLALGVSGPPRDDRAKPWGYFDERLRWWTAMTATPGVRPMRRWLEKRRSPADGAATERIVASVESAITGSTDVILVSAYYIYEEAVRAICARARSSSIPVIVGGPGFTNSSATASWLGIDGLSALVAGECEPFLEELVERAATGADLSGLPGCTPAGAAASESTEPVEPAPPLADLDNLPFPDYDDFPWERYPSRVITMLTGRGCSWGHCTFCSDVFTVNGRTFRTRSAGNVLAELKHHGERYRVKLFHFSDLKLNSDVRVWRGLIAGFQEAVPGALWTCSVHAGGQGDQGLGLEDLRAAREAGLVRITTGLETGSQALLSKMAKGVSRATLERFVDDAHEAGISVRVSMFTGYPGEGPADLDASAELLESRVERIDRVHLSRFLIMPMTPIAAEIEAAESAGGPGFEEIDVSFGTARVDAFEHTDRRIDQRAYRRSLKRLLKIVQRINRRPLPEFARPLEGAM